MPNGQLASNLFIRAFQFAYWGAVGFYFPFMNAYFRGIGLTGTQIGLIGTLSAIMAAIGAFAWGLAHDRLGKSRLVFSALCLGMILLAFLLSLQREFTFILITAALLSFFNGPTTSQTDSMTLKMLGPRTGEYGAYRMWGTTGFVVTSALAGFLLEATDIHAIFYLYMAGIFIFWLVTLRLPDRAIRQGPNLLAGLGQMTRNPQWVLLMISLLVLWVAVQGGHSFLPVALKDMGSSETTVGLAFTIAAIAEIPVLLVGPAILRRFGATRLILFAMSMYVLRMLLYAGMTTPPVALAISLMQSITYCPFLVSAVFLANHLAPEELKSTSQGLLGMVMSLSGMVGGLAGGWMYDHSGQVGLYLACAITALAALVLYGTSALNRRSAAAVGRNQH